MTIYGCQILPFVFFIFEMLFNKIRLPTHHVVYNFLLTGCYVLASYLGQIIGNDIAPYPHNLNYDCEYDASYIVNITKNEAEKNQIVDWNPWSCKNSTTEW